MSELHNFQHYFLNVIDSGPALPLSPLAIYRNTSLAGACQALADNYPVVRELVGEALFEALAVDHARACPPHTPVLALYGQEFPGWLARQPIASEITYLADVARCERMHIEAFFAADAPALALSDIASIASDCLPALRLTLHPSARTDWLATPAMPIWLAHQGDVTDEIVIEWHPGGALFTRPRSHVIARTLSRSAHRLLSGLRMGETLGEAAEAARTLYPETDVGAEFALLVETGIFAAMTERMN